jgi:hypothetical protein
MNLHYAWYCVAIQGRLTFDPTKLDLSGSWAAEGPFMQDARWNLYGTDFFAIEDPPSFLFPHSIAFISFLRPNTTTGDYDQTQFPSAYGPDVAALDPPEDPVVATFTFTVIDQDVDCDPLDFNLSLDIMYMYPPENRHFLDKDANYIPTDTPKIVNGTVMIYGSTAMGRQIDLYGGAYNAGYGAYPFPAPYGGQGPHMPMDLVIPQSEVKFCVNVTYNCWPVQSKDVGFEVEGPFDKNETTGELIPREGSYKIWVKMTNRTGTEGVACITFRMPWPCEDPEDIMGVWLVTATVNIADEIVNDTMPFYYEYLIDWIKVSTDKYYYAHDECVVVTVEYQTHSMQYYPALFAVVLTDELGVPVWMELYNVTVGGAVWCEWMIDEFSVELCIPKWAFVGFAYIHVSVYDKDPTEGGFAWTYEYTPPVEIYIIAE